MREKWSAEDKAARARRLRTLRALTLSDLIVAPAEYDLDAPDPRALIEETMSDLEEALYLLGEARAIVKKYVRENRGSIGWQERQRLSVLAKAIEAHEECAGGWTRHCKAAFRPALEWTDRNQG
jgi:hypothetical protein